MNLQGKVALITGGGTGIGRAIAYRMAKEGASVVIIGRRAEKLQESAASHPGISYMIADVLKSADIFQVLDDIDKRFGRLDIVVNNAGIAPITPIEGINMADYDRTFALNVRAVIDVTSQSIPYLKKSKGNIVNITSGLVTNPMPMNCVYTASKAAVLSMTETWAKELAPHGIRVNSVAAGATRTPLYDKLGLTIEETKDYEAAVEKNIPLGRYAEPEEIAGAVAFIASDDARYATGAHWRIDGGFGM
ncbi:putative short-chain dehydrogenase/reductase family protein (plasmid) [Selenomonas ruminantium subsp. lactilytica TAM6421]|uniref:Putative short-chain dehydrogenase/reductase family protein n=1 Tax=Selenomonas ruminantium subsp. lactilytica (strain NBRC 103574 / TAM6421) TaxID=927704 RepID=I0GVS5_SELRL|nr:SDR family oxidoreductase [Selenomonas ruminantium]BAL84862.1 putative short-chain dehydrogenase/reductase family protein [Selenomonas ruminantium subsp. lactilytica TAM6421]